MENNIKDSAEAHTQEEEDENIINQASQDNLTCDMCTRTFTQRSNLLRHKRTMHTGESKTKKCGNCNEEIVSKVAHIPVCSALKCDRCTARFDRYSRLATHRQFCQKYCQHCAKVVPSMTEHVPVCPELKCPHCEKQLARKQKLLDHIKVCRKNKDSNKSCRNCGIHFSRRVLLLNHLETCGRFLCRICDVEFENRELLAAHNTSHHNRQVGSGIRRRRLPTTFHCRYQNCHEAFESRAALMRHKVDVHFDPDRVRTWPRPYPWEYEDGTMNEQLQNVMMDNRYFCFRDHTHTDSHSSYNFPLISDHWGTDLRAGLDIVRRANQEAIKVNVSLGYVLEHVENGELRYFNAAQNFALLNQPIRIDRYVDWTQVYNQIDDETVTSNCKANRPDTKWKLLLVTNAVIDVWYLDANMGADDVPDYIKSMTCIHALTRNLHSTPYDDHRCAFRCLALHRLSKNDPNSSDAVNRPLDSELERLTTEYAVQWYTNGGVKLSQLDRFEQVYDIDLDVFSLQEDNTVIPIYSTEGTRGDNRITLNLHKNHLSYVSNISAYLIKFQCEGCGRVFDRLSNLKNHRGICTRASLNQFFFDHYKPSKTIFQKLEQERIDVPKNLRTYKWFATFDCEAALVDVTPQAGSTKWTKEHQLISISICSNVEDFKQPKCFVGKDPYKLILQAVHYLKSIATKAGGFAKNRWSDTIDNLNDLLEETKDAVLTDENKEREGDEEIEVEEESDYDDDVESEETEDNNKKKKKANTVHERIKRVYGQFIQYLETLPVLGFNSSNYDINLIKEYLFPILGLGTDEEKQQTNNKNNKKNERYSGQQNKNKTTDRHDQQDTDPTTQPLPHDPHAYVIKKNNSYTSVCSNGLKFLDVSQFQAPGLSYDRFTKAYGVKQTKSYFPYEWMDSIDKLDNTEFPPYRAFYSDLKGKNMLEVDGDKTLGLKRYNDLKDIWRREGWSCIADYVAYYNNLDVGPFVEAVEKMQEFYFEREIDIFKVAVSTPGISRQMLFKTAAEQRVSFASILGCDEDLFHTLKRNIVGGPSIIFNRDHEVGRTLLFNKHICRNILGYDANALYLWAIDQYMPCGSYVRRLGPDFKPVPRLYRKDMFDWLDYQSLQTWFPIWHERNHGEVFVGKYKVDGYCPISKQAYEFDGCYYHGCEACSKSRKTEDMEEFEKRRLNTLEKHKAIESILGKPVISITECQYKEQVQSAKSAPRYTEHEIKLRPNKTNLYDFAESRLPPFYKQHRFGPRTERTILENVRSGLLYGMVEVDIHVPDHLHNKFAEMSPLFHTVDIPFEDIGEHMQEYVKKENAKRQEENEKRGEEKGKKKVTYISEKPRRLLIGGMRAEKTLLHTDLLKWYLEHDLIVTKVHQAIEFVPQRCFRPFVKQVTEARRAADMDPSKKIIGDGCKLVGNSAFGSMIMDKSKHQQTKYITNHSKTRLLVNSPRFKSMRPISQDLDEVSLTKAKVDCDLPIQLGYTILQLGKLKILQFYYDFMQAKCKPEHFEMCEMDTDSCYMAFAEQDIPSILKPEHLQSFLDTIYNNCNDQPYTADEGYFFPRECCPTHNTLDNRAPGLFKLEASGVEMISLCSKTYSLKTEDGKTKFSSKGLNKNALTDPHERFKEVLKTGTPAAGTNKGFRAHNGGVCTYEQSRAALSYFYCKRQVEDDGRSTKPLPTILKVWPDRKLDVVDDASHPLWPGKVHNFEIGGKTYKTLVDVCTAAMEKDKPDDELVKQAFLSLAPYNPVGELVFAAEGEFRRVKFKKTHSFRWTSGLVGRAVPLVGPDQYPGLNKLAELFNEIQMDTN